MIFRQLVLENFGPYSGRQVIDLTPKTEVDESPIILFGGMNGGGKTTLMDAIRLALYGQRAQCSNRGNLGYGDFLSQCVHSQTPIQEKTSVELAFEHIREDRWIDIRVVRIWTKYPKDGKDQLCIYEGEWPDTALANTWDEYIENLLPLGISNLFLFDGEQVKELAELDTPPEGVVNAISTLLGLELVERLDVDLDVLVSRKRKALANQNQLATLEAIEVKLAEQIEAEANAKASLSTRQKELETAQRKYRKAMTAFQIEGGRIAAERSKLETQIKNLVTEWENKRIALGELAAQFLPLQLILPLLEQVKKQGIQEKQYHDYLVTQEVLTSRDARLIEYLGRLEIDMEKIQRIQQFLAKDNAVNMSKINLEETPWLRVDEEDLKQLERIISYQLPEQVEKTKLLLQAIEGIETNIDSYERQLATAAAPETYTKLDEALQFSQKELKEAQINYDSAIKQVEEIHRLITQSKKELGQYTEQSLAYQNNEHIIQTAAKVKQTLQLFRERLTLKKLNKLEVEVTDCFRYLLHKSDLIHRVAINSKNFSLSLYDLEGKQVPKHRLSAGEKQLLAIAFLWGLARVSGRSLPVAIDTPLGRLDSSHRQNLLQRYFPTASHQVILLSTDTEIAATEVEMLRQSGAIAREYLLQYQSQERQTVVKEGYFW